MTPIARTIHIWGAHAAGVLFSAARRKNFPISSDQEKFGEPPNTAREPRALPCNESSARVN